MKKIKCQICGRKTSIEDSIPYQIWNALCQDCFLRQNFLKNKKTGNKNEK